MGIRRYTYKDIPSARRAKASNEAQKQLQAILTNPVATPEQREHARQQQAIVRDWVAGTMATSTAVAPTSAREAPAPASQPEPTEHSVVLEDAVEVADMPASSEADPQQ